jgi:MFS family permease
VLFYFLRIYFLWLLPDPPPARIGQKESMVSSLARPIRDARYRIFLVFLTINAFILALVVPFAAPFMKKDLGMPDGSVVYATSAMLIGAMLTLPYWGRVADAIGNRFVLFVGLTLQSIAVALLASAPTYAEHTLACMGMCIGSFFLIGIGQSCYGIGQTVRQFHLSPHKYHGPYSNIVNATIGIATAVAAFAGGLIYNALPTTVTLADHETLSKRPFFFAAAGLLLLMVAALRLLVPIREPHATRIARLIVYNLPAPIAGPVLALARVTRGGKK